MSDHHTTSPVKVSAIKAFNDNYIWAITTDNSNKLALVDPGDAQVCIDYIEQHKLALTSILITHHHADHTGGVKSLIDYCQKIGQQVTVYGPKHEKISHLDILLSQGNIVELTDLNLSLSIIDLPGHTLGHIAYYGSDILFCGDTLFSGGCGRIFEGSPLQMHQSLNKLKALPEKTLVYCTHEYTLANLEFALTVDPLNSELVNYYNQVKHIRESSGISLPSSILREKQINPFLRSADLNIKQSAIEYSGKTLNDEMEVFTVIRQWKDNF